MTATMEDKALEKKRRKQAQKVAKRAFEKGQLAIEKAYKPLDEWDEEELARGKVRNAEGGFTPGPRPVWLTRAITEESMRRFQEVMRSNLNTLTPKAMKTVEWVLENEDVDKRGRLVIPPSVKLQAATWVVEHLLGKPTQRLEADISVKLQGILANCLVIPGNETVPAIDVESWEQAEDDE